MMYTQLYTRFYLLVVIFLFAGISYSQQTATALVKNPAFQTKIETYLDHSVDVITVTEAATSSSEIVYLDARELEEYNVSHIPNAVYIGYNDFKKSTLKDIPKDSHLVVYCSIGFRSEKIGEKLLRMGFINVQNLYGSIFEWANQGLPLHSAKGVEVSKVHTYNKTWSKWMENEQFQKVW